MSRKLVRVVGLSLFVLVCQVAVAAESLPPAAQWIPQDAVIALEVSRPEVLLQPLLGEKVAAAVTELPIYRTQASKPQFAQMLTVVKGLEAMLGTDWRTGLRKLTAGGVTFAVCPNNTVLLVVDAEDEQLLKQLHEVFLNIARSQAERQGHPDRITSAEYEGVTQWSFNAQEAHAIVGKRLIVSNRLEGLQAVLDLRTPKEPASLASAPGFRAAKKAAGAKAAAVAYANLKILKGLPNVAEALKLDRQNPLAALLLAGVTEAARASNWLALGVGVEEDTLVLRAVVDGKPGDPTGPAAFALPGKSGQGAPPNVSVPRQIAALSFYRDLHRFYAAKDDLFPDRTSGLIFFENMMGIFFSGRDLTDEVLSKLRPEVRFVVARQAYDPDVGTPETQFPAFAAIFRLRHPTEFDEMVEEAWQKAVGLFSFTRGQEAQSGLIIDRVVHAGTKFTVAHFSAAGIEDKAHLPDRFNFRPALAMPGDYVILSSTEGLAQDLIDTLGREKANPAGRPAHPIGGGNAYPTEWADSRVEIDGDQLASILQANREALVRQNMVNEGNTQEEAETIIDVFVTVAKSVKQVKLIVGTHQRLTQARLDVKLTLP